MHSEDRKFLKPNLMCCLLDDSIRCRQIAGAAHYSQRIKRRIRRINLNLKFDSRARHNFICDYHKRMIHSDRCSTGIDNSQSNGFITKNTNGFTDSDALKTAFYKLSFKTLCKYKRLFNIVTPHGINKSHLAEMLFRHFKTMPIDEESVVTTFISLIQNSGNSIDRRKFNPFNLIY